MIASIRGKADKSDTRKWRHSIVMSLYPRKRPFAALPRNDAMGHKLSFAPQQFAALFDHLVDCEEQARRNIEAESRSCSTIDEKREFIACLDIAGARNLQLAGGGGIDRGQGRKAFRGKRSVVARPVRPALGVRGGSDRRGAGEGRNQQCIAKAHDALLEVPAAPTAETTKSVRTDPRFDPHAGRCPAALNRDLVAVGIAVDGPGPALAERLGGRQRVFHELQVDAFAVDHAGID